MACIVASCHTLPIILIILIILIPMRVKDDQLMKVSLYGTAHVSGLLQVPSLKLALEGIVPPLVRFAWFSPLAQVSAQAKTPLTSEVQSPEYRHVVT